MNKLREVFDDRVISAGVSPSCSPVSDFYLWGDLKDKVYKTNPHTLDKLKQNITNEIRNITVVELNHKP